MKSFNNFFSGNGTQNIFEEDPDVLFVSMHCGTPGFYPGNIFIVIVVVIVVVVVVVVVIMVLVIVVVVIVVCVCYVITTITIVIIEMWNYLTLLRHRTIK